MKKLLVLLFGLAFSSFIDSNKSDLVARNLIKQFSEKSDVRIKNYELISEDNNDLIYIYHLEPQGFIIISADSRSFPYLGYSFDNNLSINNIPNNFSFILNNYKKNIKDNINNNTRLNSDIIENEWTNLLQENYNSTNFRNVSPLLDSEWAQSGSWNNGLEFTNSNIPVGCVAVSMSQIMYYWSYPLQGSGFNSYNDDNFGQIEVNFETAYYDYDNMADLYATSASQQLLYHTGASVNMNYDFSGSGAQVHGIYPSAEFALENYFSYSSDIEAVFLEDYTQTEFRNIIKNELDNNRPILYSGYENLEYDGGHAWNVDGYNGNNIHCNWGWGGSSNGYFNLTTMGGFEAYQTALINIIPETLTSPMALFEYEINDNNVNLFDLSDFINDSDITQWIWDFGDGASDTNFNGYANHTYSNSGIYDISLIVKNIYGYYSEPHIETIQIGSALAGDVNDDNILNILDIVMMVNFVLGSQSPTDQQFNSSDMNDDNILNILDIVTLVNTVLNS